MALLAAALLLALPQSKSASAALVGVGAYTVRLNIVEADSSTYNFIVTRELPDPAATSVTFEFDVKSVSHGPNFVCYFSAVNGTFKTAEDFQFFASGLDCDYGRCTWAHDYFVTGYKHKIVFNFAGGYNVTGETHLGVPFVPGSYNGLTADRERTYDFPETQHYGIWFNPLIGPGLGQEFTAEFEIRAYDSTGKDLQVTKNTPADVQIEGVIDEPSDTSVLSGFSKADALLWDNRYGVINSQYNPSYMSATYSGNLSFIDAADAEIAGKGATGGVLKIGMVQGSGISTIHTGTIQLGRKLTAAQIASGGELVLRLYYDGHPDAAVFMCFVSTADPTVTLDNGVTIQDQNAVPVENRVRDASEGFTNIVFTPAELTRLLDANGELASITFFTNVQNTMGQPNAIYFDRLFWSKPATVSFYDFDGAFIKSGAAKTGYTLNETGLAPDVTPPAGQLFVGFTQTMGGNDYFGGNSVINGNVSLYAKHVTEATNYGPVAGVYYDGVSGVYFELKSDKSVVSYFAKLPYKAYILAVGGYLLFDGEKLGFFDEADTITLDGATYVRAAVTWNVSYSVGTDGFAVIKVPNGARAPALTVPTIVDMIFSGWNLSGAAYNFALAVTNSFTLEGTYSFNDVADYAPFLNAYFNSADGILFILKADGAAVKYADGAAEAVTYRISASIKLILDGVEYSIDPARITAADKIFWKLDGNGYSVTLNTGGGNATKSVVGSGSYYKFAAPSAPVREGYTFKGWKTGDGQDYDFDSFVTSALTLYAVWERTGPTSPAPDGGCQSPNSIALLGMLSLAFVALRRRGG